MVQLRGLESLYSSGALLINFGEPFTCYQLLFQDFVKKYSKAVARKKSSNQARHGTFLYGSAAVWDFEKVSNNKRLYRVVYVVVTEAMV